MQAFEDFLQYKSRVPVRGAIMLNDAMDSVVLVKGWKKGANWSFPRGKINKDEADLDCAIREVYEETGFDIREAGLVLEKEDIKYIDITMREQQMRLYVFRGVPMHTHFEPRTRKEISKIQWYRLSELPAFRKKGQQAQDDPEAAVNAKKFYMVAPFLVPLKKWVVQQKRNDAQRAMSNQCLVPNFPEDTLTEEEQVTDRGEMDERAPAQASKSTPTPGIDTMEGATAALHRLLKIQPPTQGLQPEAASAVQSPAKNSGEALLELLQGKPKTGNQWNNQPAPPPQTPLEHTITTGPMPRTPHHNHPRPPVLSNVQPPPSFPQELQRHNMSSPYHGHQPPAVQNPGNFSMFQQPSIPNQRIIQPQMQAYPQHNYPTQPLQHPQPLPLHVQPAVFNGEAHGPAIPLPTIQKPTARFSKPVSLAVSQPQFTKIHGPMILPNLTQTPPKLTSHSLALLNAFKHSDLATSNTNTKSNLPLRRFTQEIDTPPAPLQELSADRGQHGRPNLPEMSGIDAKNPLPPMLQASSTRPSLSEEHRSSLLDMFKSASNKANTVDPAAVITTPTDILKGNETGSSLQDPVGPVIGSTLTVSKEESSARIESQSDISGPNSPFRPLSILARPPQSPAKESANQEPVMIHGNGLASSKISSMSATGNISFMADPRRLSSGGNLSSGASQPSQPQILKRPQQPNSLMPAELAAPSPTSFPELSAQPSLDRRTTQDPDHKQTLLSLFGKGPAAVSPSRFGQPTVSQSPESSFSTTTGLPRARIDSLVSLGGDILSGTPSRRSSQTPISQADKGFLLDYLAKNT
jgi:mRNA-decapping enzyme subunit 2